MTKELGARRFACPFLINMLIARRVLITEAYLMFEVPCCRLSFILSSVLSVHFKHHAGVLK